MQNNSIQQSKHKVISFTAEQIKIWSKKCNRVNCKININDVTNFSHKLLLTDVHVACLPRAFTNNSLSKQTSWTITEIRLAINEQCTQIVGQKCVGTFRISSSSFSSRCRKPQKVIGSETTLIISDEEMNGNVKIVQSQEDSGLLIKGITQTIDCETKEQRG